MNVVSQFARGALWVAALSVATAPVAVAQDPVEVGPHIYTVVFENEQVRVSEIHFNVGDSIPMHSHPDHFVYVLDPGTLQLSYPDGTTKDFAATPGQVVWSEAETHAAVNVGATEFRAVVVELKAPAAVPADAAQ